MILLACSIATAMPTCLADEFDVEQAISGLRRYEETIKQANVEYLVSSSKGERIQSGVVQASGGRTLNRYTYFDDKEIVRVVRPDASFQLFFDSPKWIPARLAPAQLLEPLPAANNFFLLPIEIAKSRISDLLAAEKIVTQDGANSKQIAFSGWSKLLDGRWKGKVDKGGKELGFIVLDPKNDWLCCELNIEKNKWEIVYESRDRKLMSKVILSHENEVKQVIDLKWLPELTGGQIFYLTHYGLSESLLDSPSQFSILSYLPVVIGAIGCVFILVALTLRIRTRS